MKIKRNGIEIKLTSQELRDAFLEQQRAYQLEDAETHLNDYLNYSDNEAVNSLVCRSKFGVDCCEFIDEDSEHYILSEIVEGYNRRCDCNVPENETYESVISALMERIASNNPNRGFISLVDDSFLSRMELWATEEYYLDLDFVEPDGSDYIDFYIPITFDVCEALNIPDNDDDLISMYVDYFPMSKEIRMVICYQACFDDYSFEVSLSRQQQGIIIKTLNEQAKKVYGDDMDGLYKHEKEEAEKPD